MKKAIVTVVIGTECRIMWDTVKHFFENYAVHCQSDLICINQNIVGKTGAKFEKLQLYDVLGHYERIVYVDVDTIIMPDCPNLFEVVPAHLFGAYFDSNGGNGDAESGMPNVRKEEIDSYQLAHGNIGWKQDYFNSGVIVASSIHREMFNYEIPFARSVRFYDQTCLNYRLQKYRYPYLDIGQRFNHFVALNRSVRLYNTRFQSHIIHYAGFKEFYPEKSRIEQIKHDASVIINAFNIKD